MTDAAANVNRGPDASTQPIESCSRLPRTRPSPCGAGACCCRLASPFAERIPLRRRGVAFGVVGSRSAPCGCARRGSEERSLRGGLSWLGRAGRSGCRQIWRPSVCLSGCLVSRSRTSVWLAGRLTRPFVCLSGSCVWLACLFRQSSSLSISSVRPSNCLARPSIRLACLSVWPAHPSRQSESFAPVCLSICLSARLSVRPSVRPPVRLSVRLSRLPTGVATVRLSAGSSVALLRSRRARHVSRRALSAGSAPPPHTRQTVGVCWTNGAVRTRRGVVTVRLPGLGAE